jgi:hypothetical protein
MLEHCPSRRMNIYALDCQVWYDPRNESDLEFRRPFCNGPNKNNYTGLSTVGVVNDMRD